MGSIISVFNYFVVYGRYLNLTVASGRNIYQEVKNGNEQETGDALEEGLELDKSSSSVT